VRLATAGLVAATSLVLAACATVPDGSIEAEAMACPPDSDCYDEIQPVGPGGELEMDMGNFFFDNIQGTPITGEVLVTVHNVSDAYHNAEFLGAAEGSEIPEADGNETGEGTVLLFPGEWTVICNVPGHRQAGMETTDHRLRHRGGSRGRRRGGRRGGARGGRRPDPAGRGRGAAGRDRRRRRAGRGRGHGRPGRLVRPTTVQDPVLRRGVLRLSLGALRLRGSSRATIRPR
jgi:hypothetical protein